MKKILVVLFCLWSMEVSAREVCDAKSLEMKAFAAALMAEGVDVQRAEVGIRAEPMNSHDVYVFAFIYSGIRSVWKVYVDDWLCQVISVRRS